MSDFHFRFAVYATILGLSIMIVIKLIELLAIIEKHTKHTALRTYTLGSITLRTSVLKDGRRVVDADDVAALFQAWGDGKTLTSQDAAELAKWARGER